jgi:hypothetical protein
VTMWERVPRKRVSLLVAMIGLTLGPLSASGDASMPRGVIGCGATAAHESSLRLVATVGQPLAGLVGPGGSHQVWGGFWYTPALWSSGVLPLPTPTRFALLPPRPNPARDRVTVTYAIPVPCPVTVRLYDVSGRRIRTLVDQGQSPGYYTALIGGSSLPAGVYFVRLRAGSYQETARLVVAR